LKFARVTAAFEVLWCSHTLYYYLASTWCIEMSVWKLLT